MLHNESVLHKSCSLLLDKEKLNQKRKSYEKPSQNKSANIDDDTLEISEQRPMRTCIIEKLCFFCGCEKSAEESSWHQCQILVLHKKVKTIAIELTDHRLLAKLRKGDMVATEAVYNLKCLNELYNKYWSLQNHFQEK